MPNTINISDSFRQSVKKTIFSIVLFIIVYILSTLLAVGMAIGSLALAYTMIVEAPSGIIILIALGIIALGFMVLFFFFKFAFKKNIVDRSHLIEITAEQEPRLFKLLEEVVLEVQTDFPKKVYLSANINACVFYDSSFWSMFFPIKKNLEIGIGLVNSVSEAEFKAIIGHEFGHFSQKSMKLGSFVYNVNKILFDLLYDNESFSKTIAEIANTHGLIYFFVNVGAEIINGIQKSFIKLYDRINVDYMSLSREMEFHADEVAAHIAGSSALKTALLRLDLADDAYKKVLTFHNSQVPKGLKSANIYKEHLFVMNFGAKKNNMAFANNLPQVSVQDLKNSNKSKFNIDNQWASHPSTEDRVAALEKLNIVKDGLDEKLANSIFNNIEDIQKEFTERAYSNVKFAETPTVSTFEDFETAFIEHINKSSFDSIYKGYYDSINPIIDNLDQIDKSNTNLQYDTLFSASALEILSNGLTLKQDMSILKEIASAKNIAIKTFDYDGIKYRTEDAQTLLTKLEEELKTFENAINENNINIFIYYYNLAAANGKGDELIQKYKAYNNANEEFNRSVVIHNDIVNSTQFIHTQQPINVIEFKFNEVREKEVILKSQLRAFLDNPLYDDEINSNTRQDIEYFLATNWIYFSNNRYVMENLNLLFLNLKRFHSLIHTARFIVKKDLLHTQYLLSLNS